MAAQALTRIPTQIKQQHISRLQSSFLAASSRFGSYNFREYFIRRTNEKFERDLPRLVGAKEITDQTLCDVDFSTKERLNSWFQDAVQELAVLERASAMNRLFEAPKLVVEGLGNAVIEGGGGAGMEQAQGGGGHPNKPGDTIRSPFPSSSQSSS
ncbi:hypothetical protein O181_006343 [Austropuccinia psidii MF-1]|uniref:Uncharacterized protein n=1 Tax=Austropuccinia psidii MF-1 TaxID=1389203 RepID=A0A9Q3GGH9_9BASI|nr:hypothetical protein [Austropuccinia psidii MF-1]